MSMPRFCFLLAALFDLIGAVNSAVAQSSDLNARASFGAAVALTDSELLVGEPGNRGFPGRVYIYIPASAGDWQLSQTLESPHAAHADGFGAGLSVEGSRAAIVQTNAARSVLHFAGLGDDGEWLIDRSFSPDDCGAEGSWYGTVTLVGESTYLTLMDADSMLSVTEVATDEAGCSIVSTMLLGVRAHGARTAGLAFQDGQLAVGISQEHPDGSFTDEVAFWRKKGRGWTRRSTAGAPEPDTASGFYGASIAWLGNDFVVASPERASRAGKVYTFAFAENRLTPPDTLVVPKMERDARVGSALALSADRLAVGARDDLFEYGRVTIFERGEDGSWEYSAMVEPDISYGYESITGEMVHCDEGDASGFKCSNVDLVSFLTNDDLGLTQGHQTNDVWGWTDPESGTEYAIVCTFSSTVFVDLSNPENPIVVGILPATPGTRPNWWRDAKVYDHYVYVVADNVGDHGIQIFDLHNLRDVAETPMTFETTAHYDGFDSAHNIIINEETGFAYVVGINGGGETCGGGSHMLDLTDPLDPQFVGCFGHPGTGSNGQGSTHDAQCVEYHGPDERYTGHEICIGSNGDAVSIADFSDKTNVVPIAAARYPDYVYTHQGWLTEDHRYFYQNDETDEIRGKTDGTRTMIWDLAELDDPVLLNMHVSENKATDHNYYIKGQYLFQSNYVAGLRVLDISNVENPVEVGYFDTVPWGEDQPGFAGSWSNYPFFESGVIVVSSGEEGVFFLKRSQVAN